jgi:hypothetical protein
MKPNVGAADRVIRVILGIAIIVWGIMAKNWWGVIGLLPLLTGIIGWCGLYQVMGKMSCPFSKKDDGQKDDKPKSGGCCCGKH